MLRRKGSVHAPVTRLAHRKANGHDSPEQFVTQLCKTASFAEVGLVLVHSRATRGFLDVSGLVKALPGCG